ncbi:WLM-domain-containing protein [Boletus edulis]|uniref:WLM domain-containing protein n=1 Tax=Boletus edulis BED1 TaxID=1328754 RepID=A0AAD4C4W2_BOLED|nr:WLM-domain-containing protein [Boletus edulis]KAF8448863.1 WLM domain-containing protein [Boletus edulis BED1]
MSSEATPETISLSIGFRGTTHEISLPPDAPLMRLIALLEELTSVPPTLQKLLFRGKKFQHAANLTLAQIGLRDGTKLQMLGQTAQEITSLNVTESEHQRKERILRERALKPQVKVRSTASSTITSTTYVFHKLEPLSHLPKPEAALERLSKLSSDPAIRHIMQKHQFSVGVLTELAPHEAPHLLGLNVSAGQSIKLRIRTDAYDGFRPYLEVRRVLCHELTHNVWGDHDDNFKELNSQLNREVAEFEAVEKRGTHYLVDLRGTYEPSSNEEADALIHALGGNGIPLGSDSVEDRRRRTLEAATARLRKEEEELEESCGTTVRSNKISRS